MKILAQTPSGSFLLECSEAEATHLAGFHNNYFDSNWREKRFSPGSEIQIAPMFKFLANLRSAERELKKTRDTLAAVCGLLELPVAVAEVVEKLNTKEEGPQ